MYVPKHFEQTDIVALHDVLRQYSLGTLVVATPEGLEANHIPFLFDERPNLPGILSGHVAKANPVWRCLPEDKEILVVFRGPDAYVSPSNYQAKSRDGKVVPTWNYVAVHAYGFARAVSDGRWLHALIERLTDAHEANRSTPWALADAPADYISKLAENIVGIEISITRLVGKWKMSQNRPENDRANVIADLADKASGVSATMADMEAQRRAHLSRKESV